MKFGLDLSVPTFLPIPSVWEESTGLSVSDISTETKLLSPVQIIYGVATLLNSGYRVHPWLLHGIYDHAEERFFLRDGNVSSRERILSPIQGIRLRQELLNDPFFSDKGGFLFTHTLSTRSEQHGLSLHHLQELLLTAVPQERPEILLLITVDYDTLDPHPPEVKDRNLRDLTGLGQNLLSTLVGYGGAVTSFTKPLPEKNSANLRRYFFSKKMSSVQVQKNIVHTGPTMPSLIGLTLRKGLQQINRYNITVRIHGSGRIVQQKPAAGELLNEIEICELILETEQNN